MPRYFFHIDDGIPIYDEEGSDLPDLATAKCEAVKLAGQMICDAAGNFWEKEDWKLTATDESGLTLFCLHFVGIEAAAAMSHDPTVISAKPINTKA